MKEIARIFMDEQDKKALKKLYKKTNDDIVRIALNWCDEYKEQLDNVYSNELSMYNDIIEYIWQKYEIGKYLGW